MRRIFFLLVVLFIYLASCSTMPGKFKPEYKGVDQNLQVYVKEYMELASLKGIQFKNSVTVGFKNINHGDIIGTCHYGSNFREIDIDIKYFKEHGPMQRTALLFHELSHCYCYRDHDFGKDQDYPDEKLTMFIAQVEQLICTDKKGYLEDGCPLSLMHPIILSEACINMHYNHYIEEMFDRCQPY